MSTGEAPPRGRGFGNRFLLAAVIVVALAFLYMVRVFLLPVALAVVLAIVIHPVHRAILSLVRNRPSLASLLTCGVVVVAVLLPLALVADLLVAQGVELYRNAGPWIDEAIQKSREGALGGMVEGLGDGWLASYGITLELKPILMNVLQQVGDSIPRMVNSFSRTTAGIAFDAFVILFSLFYFLRDGGRLVLALGNLVPLGAEHRERVIAGVRSTSNAVLKGIFLIALLQSVLATLTLWAFGIKGWLLWGGVILVLSVIPFVGTGAVLVPTGILKIATGDVWQGIAIIVISVFFISLVDNVLRPRIIGRDAGMHDLLVFFSIVGGIFTLGPAGLVLGPLFASVLLTLVEIYRIEFQAQEAPPDETRVPE